MKYHEDVLNHLSLKGYVKSSLRRLSGGVNSSVFELLSIDGKRTVLKIYPKRSSTDSRNRGKSEVQFLKYLSISRVTNVPVLLDYDPEFNWSLISWIEGKQLQLIHGEQIHQVVDFIKDINRPELSFERNKLALASDSCQSLSQVLSSIETRIIQFESIKPESQIADAALNFIKNQIRPHYTQLSQKLLNLTPKNHWSDLDQSLYIASPSDLGVNNLLFNGDRLFFYDFEYAGLDDLSKLATDFIVHPESPLSESQTNFFLTSLSSEFSDVLGISWHQRVNDLAPIFVVKWSLILLNSLKVNNLSQSQLEKSINYFVYMSMPR